MWLHCPGLPAWVILTATMSERESVRWTWNRYARTVVRPPGGRAEQERYRENGDRNPERTPLDPRAEGPMEHLSRYLRALPLAVGRRVLDGGCGYGYGSLLLAAAGAASVTGVDVERDAPRTAASIASEGATTGAARVRYAAGDLGRLPLRGGAVEVIVALEVLEHLRDPESFLREVSRVLAPGGCLVLSTPNRGLVSPGWIIPPNRHHVREYAPEELRDFLAPHFLEVELEGQIPGPALLRRRREGRAGRRLAVAVERAVGVDPRQWIPAPVRTRLRRLAQRLEHHSPKASGLEGGRETALDAAPRPTPDAGAEPTIAAGAGPSLAAGRPISGVLDSTVLKSRIRAWVEAGLRASGPELDGLYVYGAAKDGEQLLAYCRRPRGSGR